MLVAVILTALVALVLAADKWHSVQQRKRLAATGTPAAGRPESSTGTNYSIIEARSHQIRNSTTGR